VAWVGALTGASGDGIAIEAAIHMVSAFAASQRLVLGQVKAAEKSNEIVAVPSLLEMLEIEGAIVTVDAMGCQRDVAEKILEKKADYVLALKGNQWAHRVMAIKAPCGRLSRLLQPSRKQTVSRIPRSAAMRWSNGFPRR